MTDRAIFGRVDVVEPSRLPCPQDMTVVTIVAALNVARRLTRSPATVVAFAATLGRSLEYTTQVAAFTIDIAVLPGQREPCHEVIEVLFRDSQ